MPTDMDALAAVVAAFGDCRKPEHFTDFTHCEECADHDELLCSRDRSTLSISDVGNPGWEPISFCRPEGIAYYMPALARIALEEPTDEFGWYGSQLVSHLSPQHWPSPFYEFCNSVQRKAVASLFSHFLEFHSSSPDFDADQLRQAVERWNF